MLYCYIQNVTGDGKLARRDGTADYDVAVQINTLELAHFTIKNFPRKSGWAALLERIGQVGKAHDDMGDEYLKIVIAAQEEVRAKANKGRAVRKHSAARPK